MWFGKEMGMGCSIVVDRPSLPWIKIIALELLVLVELALTELHHSPYDTAGHVYTQWDAGGILFCLFASWGLVRGFYAGATARAYLNAKTDDGVGRLRRHFHFCRDCLLDFLVVTFLPLAGCFFSSVGTLFGAHLYGELSPQLVTDVIHLLAQVIGGFLLLYAFIAFIVFWLGSSGQGVSETVSHQRRDAIERIDILCLVGILSLCFLAISHTDFGTRSNAFEDFLLSHRSARGVWFLLVVAILPEALRTLRNLPIAFFSASLIWLAMLLPICSRPAMVALFGPDALVSSSSCGVAGVYLHASQAELHRYIDNLEGSLILDWLVMALWLNGLFCYTYCISQKRSIVTLNQLRAEHQSLCSEVRALSRIAPVWMVGLCGVFLSYFGIVVGSTMLSGLAVDTRPYLVGSTSITLLVLRDMAVLFHFNQKYLDAHFSKRCMDYFIVAYILTPIVLELVVGGSRWLLPIDAYYLPSLNIFDSELAMSLGIKMLMAGFGLWWFFRELKKAATQTRDK
jgi:hypothetical protein